MALFNALRNQRVIVQTYPEHVLLISGISRRWAYPDKIPILREKDCDEELELLSYMKQLSYMEAVYDSRPRHDNESEYLELYKDVVVFPSDDVLDLVGSPIPSVLKKRKLRSRPKAPVAKVPKLPASLGQHKSAAANSTKVKILLSPSTSGTGMRETQGTARSGKALSGIGGLTENQMAELRHDVVPLKTSVIGDLDAPDGGQRYEPIVITNTLGYSEPSSNGDDGSDQDKTCETLPNDNSPPHIEGDGQLVDDLEQLLIPPWSIKVGDTFETPQTCRQMVDNVVSQKQIDELDSASNQCISNAVNLVICQIVNIVGEARRRWEFCHQHLTEEDKKLKDFETTCEQQAKVIADLKEKLANADSCLVREVEKELQSVRVDRDNTILQLEEERSKHNAQVDSLRETYGVELKNRDKTIQKQMNLIDGFH